MLKRILRKTGEMILPPLMSVWMKTLKIKANGNINASKGRFVGAFWHGKMLVGWYLFRGNNPAAIVSESPDGELLVKLLKAWEYKIVRGSSSRSGKKALNEMVELAKEGNSIIVTPDGPTGPPRKFKAGAVVTAKRTGLPLLLCGIGCRKAVKFKSWDSFELPLPFTEVQVRFSEPVIVEENLERDEVSEKMLEAENLLNQLTQKAEQLCLN